MAEVKQDMDDFVNYREYSRADAYLPIQVRIVPEEEREHVRSRFPGQSILPEFARPPEVEDKVLSDWLIMLNTKLEYIINTLQLNSEGFSAMPFQHVNISGGGMSFGSAEPAAVGDVLEIKTVLYMPHPVSVYLYGEVLSSRQRSRDYRIAVRFIYVDEPVRDEIVRFVFERQREMIRKKRT
jgi:hypothetical protein